MFMYLTGLTYISMLDKLIKAIDEQKFDFAISIFSIVSC